jgi:hypothetical protein
MSDCSHTIEQQLLAMQFVAMKARAVIIIDASCKKSKSINSTRKNRWPADVKKGGTLPKDGRHPSI